MLLKGDLPETFTIYGAESFICARCPLSKGLFLAFLKKDRGLWTGSNWHLSLRSITDGKLDWNTGTADRNNQPTLLSEVLLEIEAKAQRRIPD
jgi:hypothetical protein